MTPKRIQLKRKKGWKMPANTVKVARPTKWGNPYTVEQYGREQAVQMFRETIENPNGPQKFKYADLIQLRGKNLACFCPIDVACHADVLIEIANKM